MGNAGVGVCGVQTFSALVPRRGPPIPTPFAYEYELSEVISVPTAAGSDASYLLQGLLEIKDTHRRRGLR